MNKDNSLPTIGILGGMSTEASREYYQRITSGVQRELGGHNVAEVLLSSVNFHIIEGLIRHDQWEEAGSFLAEKARLLELGGADCLLLATNTMHKVREAIIAAITIPFIDIIEVTAAAIRGETLRRVGLLGTYPTMTDRFYQQAYARQGVTVIAPAEQAKQELNRIIFDELCRNQVQPDSKRFYLEVVNTLRKEGAEGIILGCTEISMLIDQHDFDQFPVFDTTALHCAKAVRLSIGAEPL